MGRPRKTDSQQIQDSFCDLPIAEQAQMLETLAGLHRQAVRMNRRRYETTECSAKEKPMGSFTFVGTTSPAKNAALEIALPSDGPIADYFKEQIG